MTVTRGDDDDGIQKGDCDGRKDGVDKWDGEETGDSHGMMGDRRAMVI